MTKNQAIVLTGPFIAHMRRVAWRDKKDRNCKHSEALDRCAQEHGFQNWSLLMKAFNDKTNPFHPG